MKDDKKKTLVLVLLGVVCLGVGAFQFMSMSAPAPKPEATAQKADNAAEAYTGDRAGNGESGEPGTVADATKDQLTGLYTMALPVRDPFAEGTLPEDPTDPNSTINQNSNQTAVAPPTVAPRNSGRRPGGSRATSGSMSGTMPPFDPLPNTQAGAIGGNIQVTDPNGNTVTPESPTGGYSVSGVIQGSKNSAVLTGADGQQHLVHEGQSLDQDTKVVSVKNGEVVITRKGKTSKLKVGGTP